MVMKNTTEHACLVCGDECQRMSKSHRHMIAHPEHKTPRQFRAVQLDAEPAKKHGDNHDRMDTMSSKETGTSSEESVSSHEADQSFSSSRPDFLRYSLPRCETPEWYNTSKDPGSEFDWDAHDLRVYERERARYLATRRTPRSIAPSWRGEFDAPVASEPSRNEEFWTGAPGYSQTLYQPTPVTPIRWPSVLFPSGYPSPPWSMSSLDMFNGYESYQEPIC